TPQAMTDPLGTAAQIQPFGKQPDKPILASWMGGPGVAAGVCALNAVGIPTFQYPDTAARAFDYMWRYSYNLKGLYETPALLDDASQIGPAERSRVSETISQVRSTGRTLLTEPESKRILSAYGIPTTNTEIAQTESEAVVSACRIGFPVVLKLYSETITHKTDVGGVQLNLANPDEVRKGYRS